MVAKPVTRSRVLRRVAKYRHLLQLPELVVNTAILDRAYGMAFTSTGGAVTILIDDQHPRTNTELDSVVLHELAHAENLRLRGTLRHDKDWRAICHRLTRTSGVRVT